MSAGITNFITTGIGPRSLIKYFVLDGLSTNAAEAISAGGTLSVRSDGSRDMIVEKDDRVMSVGLDDRTMVVPFYNTNAKVG